MGKVRQIRIEGDVAYVPLTKGYEAIIDAADVPLVSAWNWNDTYRDKLIARFGRVPSMAELAKLESATHRMSLDARRERTKETIGQLVAALARPMTNQDLATATGIPMSTVCHLMLRALDEGAVKRERIQRTYIWERADAPVAVVTPKPAGPDAIPVPVRGVTFESMRTCAKHFGISVQAVHDAVKRGRQDFIGLRKRTP